METLAMLGLCRYMEELERIAHFVLLCDENTKKLPDRLRKACIALQVANTACQTHRMHTCTTHHLPP
jgi:hypothetical protein